MIEIVKLSNGVVIKVLKTGDCGCSKVNKVLVLSAAELAELKEKLKGDKRNG